MLAFRKAPIPHIEEAMGEYTEAVALSDGVEERIRSSSDILVNGKRVKFRKGTPEHEAVLDHLEWLEEKRWKFTEQQLYDFEIYKLSIIMGSVSSENLESVKIAMAAHIRYDCVNKRIDAEIKEIHEAIAVWRD